MIRAFTKLEAGDLIEGQPLYFQDPVEAEAWYWRQATRRTAQPATAVIDPGFGGAILGGRFRLDEGWTSSREQDTSRWFVSWATPERGWRPPGPTELRGLLKAAGWSQSHAGRMIGVTPRAMRMWCAGDRPISFPVWYTLRGLYLQA